MIKNYNNYFYLNKLFRKIKSNKQHIQKLKNKNYFLNKTKEQNYKKLNTNLYIKKDNFTIAYIIDIFFSQTNTLIHITNSVGKLKLFCSAGNLFFKGKGKKARTSILTNIIFILIKKITYLKNRPLILCLKNVGFKKN